MIYENVTRVVIPILIHYMASMAVSLIGGNMLDAAFLTAVTGLIVMPVFAWMFCQDRKRLRVDEEQNKMSPWTYLLIVLLAVVSNQLLSYAIALLTMNYNVSNAVQESLFGSALWAQILGVGIIVPLMEEFLFRGLMYKRLKSFVNYPAAVLLSAFIFAFYHGNLIQFLFAFPMALLLIWVYEKWGTIKAPIVFHIAVNLSSVLLAAFL